MAHVYEERAVPRFEPIARRTVALAALQPSERVLDVGCGTGLATLVAAEQVGPRGEVVGVDLSEGQLGIALAKARLRGLGWVSFERGDAARLRFEEAFDAALCNLCLPADAPATYGGMRRALRPGGRVSVALWQQGPNAFFEAFQALLEACREPRPAPEVEALRRSEEERRARRARLGSPEGLRGALEGAGLRAVDVRAERYDVPFASWRAAYDFHLAWGWNEQEVRALPAPRREALQRAVAARFGEGPFSASWHVLHVTATRR